ncbi:DUF4118 domain-containing protein [Castellaniella sp.]|uniref:DUF4118 domain-containing protein n=1 Tax=Castellaniella sp. TaxID=1955812 RepID=UPI003C715EE2
MEDRPNPDELLQVVGSNPQRHRGQLKIFFGACAGVGKTYAMLQAAHQRHAEGGLVAIGIVETHGRQDTQALTEGLACLPPREVRAAGRLASEFDLDAALASEYQLLVVDELAHSNLPGSRHAKRWQDVEELLDAGFDVYTALNVQHLDSLNDIVSGIAGIRIRETVPDHFFDQATDVVLVDLPTDDLLARLDAGKVYLPSSIAAARQHFFRRGNLTALRELALRRVADLVNADVRSYRISHAIHTVWPTRDLLMVCVGARRSQESLIREGARLAQRLQTHWIAVHISQPWESTDTQAQEALLHLASCARQAGIELVSAPGQELAPSILDYARQYNATLLILGNAATRPSLPLRPRLTERIARADPEIGLILLRTEPERRPRRPAARNGLPRPAAALALATIICCLAAGLANGLLRVFDLSNVVMLFLITVVFIALKLGRLAGAWASILCVAFFDFFFVPPQFSFSVSDTQYIFTFGVMLAVALIIGQLAAKLRAEAKAAQDGERRASTLVRVTRGLAGAIMVDQIIAICRDMIGPLFNMQALLLLPGGNGQLLAAPLPGGVDLSVAQWCFDHTEAAGHGTQTLNAAPALYLPLKGPMAPRGVLAMLPASPSVPTAPDDRRLLEACCAAIAQALERIHYVDVAQDTIMRMEGEKMRNTLLSSVSHDLRTPLTAIRGLAETLEHPADLGDAERRDIARSIRVESDELRRLVSNLLDLARMQSEGVTLHKEWHSLCDIVGSALARSSSVLHPRVVTTHLPHDLPLVEVDAALIERVLGNLFDNAAKYTPATSTIAIRSRHTDTTIVLLIEDDGPGFPCDDPETLFESFARGRKESSIAGVGLGLALCRQIIGAHGGTITARSRLPRGAIFDIHLPLRPAPGIDNESQA